MHSRKWVVSLFLKYFSNFFKLVGNIFQGSDLHVLFSKPLSVLLYNLTKNYLQLPSPPPSISFSQHFKATELRITEIIMQGTPCKFLIYFTGLLPQSWELLANISPSPYFSIVSFALLPFCEQKHGHEKFKDVDNMKINLKTTKYQQKCNLAL